MKCIHSADWHIGRVFQNICLLDDQLYALAQLKAYIIEQDVDVLMIAGDLFDRSVPSAIAIEKLNDYLNSLLTELELTIVIISGNHDSAKRLGFGALQMQQAGLYILTDITEVTQPVSIVSADGQCLDIYGIPYHEPAEVREAFSCDVTNYEQAHRYLVDKIKAVRKTDRPNMLVSHCFIAGAVASESERPLAVGGLECVSYQCLQDFDYVALGHLHAPQHKGKPHICYSGSLLKYSFSEHQHKKSVNLLEFTRDGLSSIKALPVVAKHDLRIITGLLNDILDKAASDPYREDYILVRLDDREELLDAMGQLRAFYPNVVQLEYPRLMLSSNTLVVNLDGQKTEIEVFNHFFEQVVGQTLNSAQQHLLTEIINDAYLSLDADE